MKNKITLLFFLSIVNMSCQTQNNKKTINEVKNDVTDLLEVDFNTDIKKITDASKFQNTQSEFSEYLMAITTNDVDPFSLGSYKILSKTLINDFEVPNGNYISFVTKDETVKTIVAVHLKLNYLNNKNEIFELISNKLGKKPKLINDADSINTLKNIENYMWDNYKNNKTIIISIFSEGNMVSVSDDNSSKLYSALIYLIDNEANIDYPNSQKENVLERLYNRFSN